MAADGPSVAGFEDLHCWRAARDLLRDLGREDTDRGGAIARTPLGDDLIRRAAAVVGGIAAAFRLGDPRPFIEGLRRVLGDIRALRALLLAAGEGGLLGPKERDEYLRRTEELARAVKEHIRYLTNLEIRRLYRELDEEW